MLPVERVIGEEGLRATSDGLRLAMRLPWYRSLPFSTVEIAELVIDDAPVDLATARVEYEGNSWSLAELAEQTDAFWFVRDSAYLHVAGHRLNVGADHRVALNILVSPPYIPGMKRSNPQSETLRVA